MHARRFLSVGLVSVFALAFAATSHAQLIQYKFTGTRISGSAEFGEALYGTITLDPGAEPDGVQEFTPDDGGGQYAYWKSVNGNFAIDAVTSGGQVAGTALGGDTYFDAIDDPFYSPPFVSGFLHTAVQSGGFETGLRFLTRDDGEVNDGIVEVSDWSPLDDEFIFIRFYVYDIANDVNKFTQYRLDTFELVRDTIVIDGRDTGVDDFEYEGELVSERIEAYADAAKSHGQFVSQVNKLTRELVKAGLLSAEERDAIQDAASASSIGKRQRLSSSGKSAPRPRRAPGR